MYLLSGILQPTLCTFLKITLHHKNILMWQALGRKSQIIITEFKSKSHQTKAHQARAHRKGDRRRHYATRGAESLGEVRSLQKFRYRDADFSACKRQALGEKRTVLEHVIQS